jgi:hypothetical protein
VCSVVRLTGSYRPCLSRFLISSSRHSLRSVPSPKDRMFTRVFPRFGSSRLFLGSFRSSFASSSSRPNRTEPFGRGRWRERTRWRGKEPSMNGPFTSLYVPFGPFLGSFHLPLGPSYRRALREEVSGGRMTKRADKQRDREEWDTTVHSFLPHRLISSSSLRSLRSLRSENDMRVRMRSTGTNMEVMRAEGRG